MSGNVSDASVTSGPSSRERRILIVDDARDSVLMLGRLLEMIGHRVATACTAAEALQLVRRDRPDIVISDIAMPDMDGYELARLLRNGPHGQGLVLVALTGYGLASDRAKALAAGFDHHLIKPVSLEALQELLDAPP
jgi:CheY-like chemotaxis protein